MHLDKPRGIGLMYVNNFPCMKFLLHLIILQQLLLKQILKKFNHISIYPVVLTGAGKLYLHRSQIKTAEQGFSLKTWSRFSVPSVAKISLWGFCFFCFFMSVCFFCCCGGLFYICIFIYLCIYIFILTEIWLVISTCCC